MFNVALVVVLNGICPRIFGELLPTAVHDNIVGFQVSDYLVDVDGWMEWGKDVMSKEVILNFRDSWP